ncbi:MAG: phosphatase PAP2 family protein [Dehalococcoidia bacterium]|nr:phosphatase PAP2 family protein [Dehalococcoidia bacterium]
MAFREPVGISEAVLVVPAFLVYFTIRAAVVSQAGTALVNAYEIIALERALGLYWELEMQSWILDSYASIRVMNWVYFWGHMPAIIVFAVWLWTWHRPTYLLMRNAFLVAGAIGVVMYATYPLAPPRLVPFEGYVDTMALFDRVSYQAQETRAFVNPYAAMPSLHFGWAMLLGGAVAWVGRRNPLLVFVGVAWPVLMFLAIVLTGNHFILDAVAGAIVSLAGLGIAYHLHRAQPALVAWLRRRVPPLDRAMDRYQGDRASAP